MVDPFEVLVSEDITNWTREEIVNVFLRYENGKVIFIEKAHVAAMYNTFLVGLYLDLMRIVGVAAKGLILNAARNGGLRAGKAIRKRYQKEKGELTRDKACKIAKNMLAIWAKGFAWGNIDADVNCEEIKVRIFDSFEGDGYRRLRREPAKQPMCWMIFGYMWGLFEGILDKKLEGEEVECIAMGNEHCTFVFRAAEAGE
ncbi:V4R domain-containing protein [Archaeoglobus veneficus]|uniref:4-vinyl reductase 4VR n=1 Tax=Archaeoglobus veneficus (strain DSM 11195 / SNP6) TaxID=693661 RepID=F2KQ30_ARCVS|nr:V4R domain-containing protein [Archaeoglobus veneficus]AEA47633.1 4-vinyl reductase 4VR [Archaeoglobus veneficus SNP6]